MYDYIGFDVDDLGFKFPIIRDHVFGNIHTIKTQFDHYTLCLHTYSPHISDSVVELTWQTHLIGDRFDLCVFRTSRGYEILSCGETFLSQFVG